MATVAGVTLLVAAAVAAVVIVAGGSGGSGTTSTGRSWIPSTPKSGNSTTRRFTK